MRNTLAALVFVLAAGHAMYGQASETPHESQISSQPASEAIQAIQRYYFGGDHEAPVLVDLQFCQGIHKEGARLHDCQNPLDKDQLVVGEPFYVWMNFLVPQGEEAKVLVHLDHDGFTRTARALDIRPGIRYRTWTRVQLTKSGEWHMPIFYENREGIQELGDVTFNLI